MKSKADLGLGKPWNKCWTLGSGAEEGVCLKSYHRSDNDDDDNDDDDNDDDDDDDDDEYDYDYVYDIGIPQDPLS